MQVRAQGEFVPRHRPQTQRARRKWRCSSFEACDYSSCILARQTGLYVSCKSVVKSDCAVSRIGRGRDKFEFMGSPAAAYLCEDEQDYVISFSGIEVNLDRGTVMRDGRAIKLASSEFELLTHFLMNVNRDLSRDSILQSVWGYLADPNTRTVDAHVMRLRQKLEPDPNQPRHFITLHRVGYRFVP